MRQIAEEQHLWVFERGLASLLPFLQDDDGSDDDIIDTDVGLAQLLRYEPSPRIERPHGYVTKAFRQNKLFILMANWLSSMLCKMP
jgi:hypothetical protein